LRWFFGICVAAARLGFFQTRFDAGDKPGAIGRAHVHAEVIDPKKTVAM
jgi:hypothetical protein